MPEQIALNIDCMEYMKTVPDKYFDLAVVDPPYGDGNGGKANRYGESTCSHSVNVEREQEPKYNRFGGRFDRCKRDEDWRDVGGKVRKKIIAWDVAPGEEYFRELFRVSRQQIIWGGNYFSLPPTRCFIVWKKTNIPENFSMSMCEYAWTSFNDNAKVVEVSSQNQQGRFHPTQKPIALYDWIFTKYAEPGYRILDTHLGSGSSRIAAHKANLDFVGCEIDKDYFEKQEERFAKFTAQISLFTEEEHNAEM